MLQRLAGSTRALALPKVPLRDVAWQTLQLSLEKLAQVLDRGATWVPGEAPDVADQSTDQNAFTFQAAQLPLDSHRRHVKRGGYAASVAFTVVLQE